MLLSEIFDGWQGYQTSIVHAIAPLTMGQLRWRPFPDANSVGEIVRHISLGRLIWFFRMRAPGSEVLAKKIATWERDSDGNAYIVERAVQIVDDVDELISWLDQTWLMIEDTLSTWQVSDIQKTYPYVWNQNTYANSRQWTLWRILSHDIHHGGELSLMLGMQGIKAFELCDLFGHIVLPPLLECKG